MAEETSSNDRPWLFKPGNKHSRGNPLARAVSLFRVQIIKKIKSEKAIPRTTDVLFEMALDGTRPVKLRRKINGTLKTKRKLVHEPVPPAIQLAAMQEILSRAMGKATQYKVIDDQRDKSPGNVDYAKMVAVLISVGAPVERWPVGAREWQKKQIEAAEKKV